MIIIDELLRQRKEQGRPIKVGIFGAGEMGKGIVYQIMKYTAGIEVAVICNRTINKALEVFKNLNIKAVACNDLLSLQQTLDSNGYVVTDNPELLCEVDGVDLLVECTGTINYAARIVLYALQNKKNVLLYNPELEATLGPILKKYASDNGCLLGGCDGDQPGAILNLYRYVKMIGLVPLVCGNIKGLQDFYRNPTTQESFAKKWGQNPYMVTSFADGTKISFEQACVANATGMRVAKRGMIGYHHDGHIDEMVNKYDVEQLKEMGGMIDYVVGPKPGPGVYVFATTDDPNLKKYLSYMKMGDGPLYSFYTPYHLICMETPITIARMALLNDTATTPIGAPVVEVITCAKTDLEMGQRLDGIGGYQAYGQCENADISSEENLLPMGLSEGAIIKHSLKKSQVISFNDVEFETESISLQLYREQQSFFAGLNKQGLFSNN